MATRFILAKYVPDLSRMEPRNIGVFAWQKGAMRHRFLNVEDAARVSVKDIGTFQRWITFWTQMTSSGHISPRRGKPVSIDDPACIDALISTQKGNYILVDAGELLRPTRKSEIGRVCEHLFNELVAIKPTPLKTAETFLRSCTTLFERAGVAAKQHHPVECTWEGVSRKLHPDFYVGNGHPDAIFQSAKVSSEKSVNHGVLLVHSLLNYGVVSRNSCRFLVRTSDITSAAAEDSVKLCERMCGIIDIDSPVADKSIRSIAVQSSVEPTSDL